MVAPGVRHSAECRRKQAEFRDLEQQFVAPQGELEDAPYSPSLGPEEPADEPADVNMEMLPEASSAPAEAAPSAAAEQSAPGVAQEDVAMDFEATDHREPMDISMIDVCQCSEQIRIGCLTSLDLLFQERLSVESISFSGAGDMTEVNYDPDIQSEVPEIPEVCPPTVEVTPAASAPVPSAEARMEEPETPVLEPKPKVKAMPKRRKASAKPAEKRMPRPTVKKVKVFPPAWSEEDALDFICPILMRTDSLSGKMLLEGTDLQGRSRHIDIKVFWLRELLARGVLKLQHVRGTINPADHFTKCLSTAKYLEYASVLGFLPFESLLMNSLMMNLEIKDSSFAGTLCRYSVRQCLLCGEPVEPFFDFQQERDEPDEAVVENHVVFGLLYHSGQSMLHDCSCFDVGSTPPGDRAMPGAGDMTEVNYDPDIQSEVPEIPEVCPPTVEVTPAVSASVPSAEARMEEPETPVLEPKPKVKAMPKRRKASAKPVKPAEKRMPRPTVKKVKVKQEIAESVRGTFRARQTENNRKRRLAWKARQKEAAEYFKKARLEEEQRPADVIAVERSTRGREVQRRAFNPATGKREIMNITLKDKTEGVNTKMLTSFRGFSKKPVMARWAT
eukprot:s379_g32.t1